MDVPGSGPELALWEEERVVRLGPVWPLGATVAPEPMALLAAGAEGVALLRAAAAAARRRPELQCSVESLTVLPPVPRPPRIFCLARNYPAHARERGSTAPPAFPHVFLKPGPGVLNHHRGEIPLDPETERLDYEAELAVVIGRTGRRLTAEEALARVWGYTLVNDITEREPPGSGEGREAFFRWLRGKWRDGSLPMGPCVLLADGAPPPDRFRLTGAVNGEIRQHATTAEMIFSVAEILADLSRTLTLLPGDVIATGTPAGVGWKDARYLRPGDVVTVSVPEIGTLTNRVVLRPPPQRGRRAPDPPLLRW